jgi:hypothetical protein
MPDDAVGAVATVNVVEAASGDLLEAPDNAVLIRIVPFLLRLTPVHC